MIRKSVKVKPGVIFWNAKGRFIFADLSANRYGDLTKDEFLFISSCHEVKASRLAEDDMRTMSSLEKKGLLTHEDLEEQFLRFSQRQEEKSVFFELTKACNLACRMCYNDSGQPLPDEMTLQEWKEAISKVSELGKCNITLTGGEPFMRSDVLDLIRHAKEYGHTVEIITNGTLIDSRLASCLHSLETDFVFVSVDSANAKTFDWIRGRDGSFDKVVQATQVLGRENVPFGWLVTLMRPNLNELPNIFELATALRVPKIWLSRIVFAGRASEDLVISAVEEHQAREIAAILEKRYSGELTVIFGSFLSCDTEKGERGNFLKNSPCDLGISRFYISSDGHVTLCHLLSSKQFYCGHILRDNIQEILASSWFKMLSETPLDKFNVCGHCGLRYLCLGGCRGEAYLMTGNIKGCDLYHREYLLHVLDRATDFDSDFIKSIIKCKE